MLGGRGVGKIFEERAGGPAMLRAWRRLADPWAKRSNIESGGALGDDPSLRKELARRRPRRHRPPCYWCKSPGQLILLIAATL
jgi:hypothetical protein